MKRHLLGLLVVWAITGTGHGGAAPALPPGQAGLPPILTKVFGESAVFSAKAQVRLTGKTPSESMLLPMVFYFSRGNMRADINMADVRSDALPKEMLLSLKQIGMDRVVTIMRPGNQPAWILYPHLKASLEVPPPIDSPAGRSAKESVRETKLGEEIVEGESCDKHRLVYRDSQSRSHEALVWRTRDSQRFPRQIQMTHADTTMLVRYTDVEFASLSHDLFVLPAGYTRYDTMEKVMQEALKSLLTGPKTTP